MDALVWQIETAIQDRVVSSLRSLGWSDLGTPSRLERFLGRPRRDLAAPAAAAVAW